MATESANSVLVAASDLPVNRELGMVSHLVPTAVEAAKPMPTLDSQLAPDSSRAHLPLSLVMQESNPAAVAHFPLVLGARSLVTVVLGPPTRAVLAAISQCVRVTVPEDLLPIVSLDLPVAVVEFAPVVAHKHVLAVAISELPVADSRLVVVASQLPLAGLEL
jgi:hypothetical protein